MKSPARRFTLVMLAMSAIFLGAPVLLNYVVDPYDRFGNNRLGVYIMAEREVKNTEVARRPHDALLLGNSRIAAIPTNGLDGFQFFNAAFSDASAEEIYFFLLHHTKNQRLVVLGIDLGTQDPATLHGDTFRNDDWARAADNLLNLQTLEYSFKTIFSHVAGKPSHYLPDGAIAPLAEMGNTEQPGAPTHSVFLRSLKGAIAERVLKRPRSFLFYGKIAALLRERGIPCVVVMPPMHAEVMQYLESQNLISERETWTSELRAIFPHLIDLTSSRYSAPSGFPARDPVHYNSAIGVDFMNREVVPSALRIVHGETKN